MGSPDAGCREDQGSNRKQRAEMPARPAKGAGFGQVNGAEGEG